MSEYFDCDYTAFCRYVRDLLVEASMLARARHRNLVNFLGISLGQRGRLLIVMERCMCSLNEFLTDPLKLAMVERKGGANTVESAVVNVGTSSAQLSSTSFSSRRLRQRRPQQSTLHRVSIEMCEGLVFLHDVLGVVHRDVKPDNVFVSFKGTVKLGDLGSACLQSALASNEDGTVSTDRRPFGTPLYLAPEAFPRAARVPWTDEPKFTSRVDVYAAAITICEIFSGSAPYAHVKPPIPSAQTLYDAVTEGLRPSTVGVPEHIRALCVDAWSLLPSSRPSAAEVVGRLRLFKSVSDWHANSAQSHKRNVVDIRVAVPNTAAPTGSIDIAHVNNRNTELSESLFVSP